MRFIPRNCIQPEAVLASPILSATGEVLLQKGIKMKPVYIDKLKSLGIPGAYVDDPISEDLQIVGVLSDELRTYAIKNIFTTFNKAAQSRGDQKADAMLVLKTAEQIVDEILEHGDVMLNLFDMKVYDSYTFFHCVNVTVLSVVIGIGLNMNRNELIDLAYAALLHDIGKVFIDSYIINKPGQLTPEEFDIVKKHPQDGYNYIKENYYLTVGEITARGVLDHHERFDGTGYPNKTAGDRITPFGRIIAIADVYDALISDRSYRKGLFAVEAMEYVQGGSGTLFDFDMVQVFSQKVALFPVGTCVSLSNGAIGLVMENFEGFAQRPRLRIFKHNAELVKPYLINLREEAFDLTVISTVAV